MSPLSQSRWSGKLWGARHGEERKEHEVTDRKQDDDFSQQDVLEAVKVIREELSSDYVDIGGKWSEKRLRRMSSACVLWYQEGKAPDVWMRDDLENLDHAPTLVQYLHGCSPANAINLAILQKVSERVYDLYTANMADRRMYNVDQAIGHEVRHMTKLAEDYDVGDDEVQRVLDLVEDPASNVWFDLCEEFEMTDGRCHYGRRCKKLHLHKRTERG